MAKTDFHTPKGFRDILPNLAQKRRKTINTIVSILEKYGFVPIETPTAEFSETLTGKYGEEERLIYKFTDRGGRNLALRYDLTVPLARYVATHNPPLPFRRYQVGQVFRGENPQKGRWREFTQLDFDTVGTNILDEDAKIISCAIEAIKAIGFKKPVMFINDRKNFEGITGEVTVAIDKLHKIGREGVEKELQGKGFSKSEIENFILKISQAKPTEDLKQIFEKLEKKHNLSEGKDFIFDPTLARGLNYYTGSIFELKPNDDVKELTIGSGGRYDNLVGMFSKKDIPAVGFSFGLDRICELPE